MGFFFHQSIDELHCLETYSCVFSHCITHFHSDCFLYRASRLKVYWRNGRQMKANCRYCFYPQQGSRVKPNGFVSNHFILPLVSEAEGPVAWVFPCHRRVCARGETLVEIQPCKISHQKNLIFDEYAADMLHFNDIFYCHRISIPLTNSGFKYILLNFSMMMQQKRISIHMYFVKS